MAFLRTRRTPLTTELIVAAPDGGQEHVLASSTADLQIVQLNAPWRPNIPPAWSPDGRVIAVSAARPERPAGCVLFVDSQTGSTQEVTAPMAAGLGWLDPQALVINAMIGRAPGQLFRLTYPAGSITRLTNDPNHYAGISLTDDRSSLVTARRDARMDVWVGDGGAATGTDVVPRVPVSVPGLAWAADQLLYSGFVGGRPAILRVIPGEGRPEEVLIVDAVLPAATSDGGTIVFVSTSGGLWTADASGRRITQLAPTGSDSAIVIANDRFVLYRSIVGGSVSIWMVPIEGGTTPKKVTDGGSVTVSPDGQSIAFTTLPADGRSSLVTCALPGCSSRHEIGVVPGEAPLAWTPEGDGVAYARDGNVWVQPLSGGAPKRLTRFTDNRSIGSFAWSRDGTRLAITRLTTSNDIVLFRGLK